LKNITKIILSKKIALTLFLCTFFYSFFLVWQGLDFTDMGFMLSSYQQFYLNPDSNIYFLINWLTIFIGYWSGETFGGGVIVYKLSATFIIAICSWLSYSSLSYIFGRSWCLALFIFISFLFITKANGNWINYNNLTSLFYLIGGIALFHGLNNNRIFLILLSGLVFGINIFIRFPNILGFSLIGIIFLFSYIVKLNFKKSILLSLSFLIGWILGILLILLLILLHGHQDYYLQSLMLILGKTSENASLYSGFNLLKMLIKDQLLAFVLGGCWLLITFFVLSFSINNKKNIYFINILFVGFTIYIFELFNIWIWMIPGILYYSLFIIIIKNWKNSKEITLLAVISLFILIITPLGSGNGIHNAIYGSWLALPLVLNWFWLQSTTKNLNDMRWPRFQINIKNTLITLIFSISLFSILKSLSYVYRDSQNRLELKYNINHPLLKGVYTTYARSIVVNELLLELNKWVKPGDILFAYPQIPMVNFLKKTTSWLSNPWPVLQAQSNPFEKIKNFDIGSQKLPVIVRSKGDTGIDSWPLDCVRDKKNNIEIKWKEYDRFTEKYYNLVWSNNFFEILIPKKF
jgi:hypothetical protein